ncbi:MAG: AI-2E family transporter [Akkermansia sp.]|nr:AI-2E family transporter [Akkermansia sp.]
MADSSEEKKERQPFFGEGARFLLTAAAAIIVIMGLQAARSVLLPIMMAGFLAIISYSITKLLSKYLRFPHWLAVTATVAADGGILFGVASIIKFLAADMKSTLQGDFTARMVEKYNELMHWLGNFGLEEQARAVVSSPQEVFDMQQLVGLIQTISGQAITFVTTCTLVLVLMTFMLGEAKLFKRNLHRLPNSTKGKEDFTVALRGIQRYLLIKTISSATTGALAWWACAAMDVPFAFLWGVIAYVLNYIPTIGSIVAAIPPIVMALLMGSWGDAAVITFCYIVINFMIGNGIEPIFLGKQFGIATSVVLLAVLFWGWVWGPVGMLLAVPIMVLIKLALENSRDLSWVATIISDEPPPHVQKLNQNKLID